MNYLKVMKQKKRYLDLVTTAIMQFKTKLDHPF